MTTFSDLQVGYYNALLTGLGFQTGYPFQMLQPSAPVVGGPSSNTLLWNYVNNLPPFSLTNNFIASGGAQFFSNYGGMLSALQSGANNFDSTVGPSCSAAWNAYVPGIPLTVPLSQFPQVFQRWATVNGYTDVAQSGASALAGALLDPVFAAQTSMLAYTGKKADWDQGYTDLVSNLSAAPGVHFTMNSATMDSSSQNTWASSSKSAFFGLWTSSSSTSSSSSMFASSNVNIDAAFDHLTTFAPVAGAWYNSAVMGEAFSNPNKAPWKANNPISWATTFDSSSGNMARFVSNIIVASGMRISVTSDAQYDKDQQLEIQSNSGAGMYPFYSQNSSDGTNTKAEFNASGNLQVTITSTAPTPIVLGSTVTPAAQFVGTAVEGAKMYRQALLERA